MTETDFKNYLSPDGECSFLMSQAWVTDWLIRFFTGKSPAHPCTGQPNLKCADCQVLILLGNPSLPPTA